ncbi:hypothetical protein DITRI_Ditri02bG0100500 [Diplodiscus trichospermus]
MSHTLFLVLAEEELRGNKPSSIFKSESFHCVAKEISQKFGVECLPEHVENHLKTLKKEWTIITTIHAKSGFG